MAETFCVLLVYLKVIIVAVVGNSPLWHVVEAVESLPLHGVLKEKECNLERFGQGC